MIKFFKAIFRLLLLVGAAYAGFKISRKIASGQLTMKFNSDGPFGTLDVENIGQLDEKVVLNQRQRQIYKYLADNQEADMTSLAKKVKGVTSRTLRRDLGKLVEIGLVSKEGKTKSAKYRLTDK